MIETIKIGDITIASFEKDIIKLNLVISQQVKEKLKELLNKTNPKLILNLEGINFIDSSGFGTLVSVFNTAKDNNFIFKLCNISSNTMQLVKITKLQDVFEIHDNLDECIKSFS